MLQASQSVAKCRVYTCGICNTMQSRMDLSSKIEFWHIKQSWRCFSVARYLYDAQNQNKTASSLDLHKRDLKGLTLSDLSNR